MSDVALLDGNVLSALIDPRDIHSELAYGLHHGVAVLLKVARVCSGAAARRFVLGGQSVRRLRA